MANHQTVLPCLVVCAAADAAVALNVADNEVQLLINIFWPKEHGQKPHTDFCVIAV